MPGPTASSTPWKSRCLSSRSPGPASPSSRSCVSYEAGYGDLEALGRALAGAVTASGRETLLVASTDMSHYVSRARAAELDGLAIERVLQLDPRGLYDVVERLGITMCGVRPTAAVLVAALALGASRAALVRYTTSGDVTGDDREVVGYAGITVS